MASSMNGLFSLSLNNFHSAPSLFEISELCILGFSCAIFLLWPLDHTIKAFMGLLMCSWFRGLGEDISTQKKIKSLYEEIIIFQTGIIVIPLVVIGWGGILNVVSRVVWMIDWHKQFGITIFDYSPIWAIRVGVVGGRREYFVVRAPGNGKSNREISGDVKELVNGKLEVCCWKKKTSNLGDYCVVKAACGVRYWKPSYYKHCKGRFIYLFFF